MAYNVTTAGILFRATWDYIPECVLRLFRFIPVEPFVRLRKMERLFVKIGEAIIRENRDDSDAYAQADKLDARKDLMSLLSE